MNTMWRIMIMLIVLVIGLTTSLRGLGQESDTLSFSEPVLTFEDSLRNEIELIKSYQEKQGKIKISGYFQGQFQVAENAGTKSFEGGNFPTGSDKRFAVRRGRVKFLYEQEFTQMVVQIDATEKGVSLKDAYTMFRLPYIHSVALTTGVFNRPFGYEIAYSSTLRESPERARWEQTLFPGERDLGAMITFNPMKTSKYNWIKVNAGLFCGNGINADFDKKKDFIGQISISKATANEKIKWGGGVSYYNGGVFQGTKYIYNMSTAADNSNIFKVDSTSANKGKLASREYYGADAQISFDWFGGLTTLRGEYITGTQPASLSSSSSLSTSTAPTTDTHIRNFSGYNVYFVQNILHSKNDIVVKYDSYDPNTSVEGASIKSKYSNGGTDVSTYLSSSDIKYNTLGIGWIYHFDQNIKISAYYALVQNEKTSLTGYISDVKDNVFTLRIQYKF